MSYDENLLINHIKEILIFCENLWFTVMVRKLFYCMEDYIKIIKTNNKN